MPITSYIELFDDELYHSNKDDPIVLQQLIETTRLKCLICLLFGQQIKVPEQWAVSSPLFVKVGAEIIRGWQTYRQTVAQSRANPPILLYYFNRPGISDDQKLLDGAFIERFSDHKRRIKLNARLDNDVDEAAGAKRDKFVEVLGSADFTSQAGIDRLNDVLGDEQQSSDLAFILEYARHQSINHRFEYPAYAGQLLSHFGQVESLFQSFGTSNERFSEEEAEIIKAVDQFFEFSSQGKPRSDYVQMMQDVHKRLDPKSAAFVEGLGRVGIHKSFSKELRADVHGASFSMFKGVGLDSFFSRAFRDIYSSDKGFDELLDEDIVVEEKGFVPVTWPVLWSSIYKILDDKKWVEYLSQAKVKIERTEFELAAINDTLMEVFLRLNDALEGAYFSIYPNDDLSIVPTFLKGGGALMTASGAAGAALAAAPLFGEGAPVLVDTSDGIQPGEAMISAAPILLMSLGLTSFWIKKHQLKLRNLGKLASGRIANYSLLK